MRISFGKGLCVSGAVFFIFGALAVASPAGAATANAPNAPAPEALAGWSFLRWGMDLAAARAAFAAQGVPYDEHFMAKDGTTYLVFDRGGWEGVAYFDAARSLTEVIFQSPPFRAAAQAGRRVTELTAQYGADYEYNDAAYRDERRADVRYTWRLGATTVKLLIAHYFDDDEWVAWESYGPARPGDE